MLSPRLTAAHSVERGYAFRDPPLTETGKQQAQAVNAAPMPDLVIVSPMTRTLQTALLAFGPTLGEPSGDGPKVEIWPDLRETYGAICNHGVSRADLASQFPQFDYAECHEEWDYPKYSAQEATERAERVRGRLRELNAVYENIYVITHRGFIAFLVQGERFDFCGRFYTFIQETSVCLIKKQSTGDIDSRPRTRSAVAVTQCLPTRDCRGILDRPF